jgi:hypothetical protein
LGPAACSIISFSALRLADLRLGVRAGRGWAGIGGAALRRGAEPGAVVQSIRSSLVASIRKIRGRDGRRRDSAVRRRGRGSRGTSAHAARRVVAQRPGAGTRVLGVHGLTGRCECARCVTWGTNLPDGDPKILGGRTRNRGFFSGIPRRVFYFFPGPEFKKPQSPGEREIGLGKTRYT